MYKLKMVPLKIVEGKLIPADFYVEVDRDKVVNFHYFQPCIPNGSDLIPVYLIYHQARDNYFLGVSRRRLKRKDIKKSTILKIGNEFFVDPSNVKSINKDHRVVLSEEEPC